MRIVNHEQFLQLPENTLYFKYEPDYLHSFGIKMDTIQSREDGRAIDWFYQDLEYPSYDVEAKMRAVGETIRLDFACQGRDGCFDQDQLFAVFEPGEVQDLIDRLRECL